MTHPIYNWWFWAHLVYFGSCYGFHEGDIRFWAPTKTVMILCSHCELGLNDMPRGPVIVVSTLQGSGCQPAVIKFTPYITTSLPLTLGASWSLFSGGHHTLTLEACAAKLTSCFSSLVGPFSVNLSSNQNSTNGRPSLVFTNMAAASCITWQFK